MLFYRKRLSVYCGDCSVTAEDGSPGVRARITQSGLDYGTTRSTKMYIAYVPKICHCYFLNNFVKHWPHTCATDTRY